MLFRSAMVQFDGLRLPRGKLTLEWSVDNITMDKRPVAPNQLVEYGNEPTAGSYRVTLRMDGRPIHTFSFRITP